MSEHSSEHYVTLDQLEVGLFIHLDMDWMEHPFAFPNFKIKSQDQIDKIKALGREQFRYDPSKSDVQPKRSAPTTVAKTVDVATKDQQEYESFLKAKRERQERLQSQREAIEAAEKKFENAATAVKAISTNMFSKPEESIKAADNLVNQMVESILVDKDIAMHLMGNKKLGEELYFHALNVSVLAMMLGKELKLPKEAIYHLGMGGIFHDLGKVDIPDKILLKTDALTKAEQDFFEQHCAYGFDLGKKMGLAKETLMIIAQHHELADGSGYPKGLSGGQIFSLARIITVANVYDNLCNHLVPSKSMTPHEALSLMYAHRRAQFDNATLSQFIRTMGVYPPGTIVRMNNEMTGMVVSVNTHKPLRPNVLIYQENVPIERAIIIDLDNEPELSIAKSIRPGQLPKPIFDYLNPRKHVTYYFDAINKQASSTDAGKGKG